MSVGMRGRGGGYQVVVELEDGGDVAAAIAVVGRGPHLSPSTSQPPLKPGNLRRLGSADHTLPSQKSTPLETWQLTAVGQR